MHLAWVIVVVVILLPLLLLVFAWGPRGMASEAAQDAAKKDSDELEKDLYTPPETPQEKQELQQEQIEKEREPFGE
jgi:hypothetical protein